MKTTCVLALFWGMHLGAGMVWGQVENRPPLPDGPIPRPPEALSAWRIQYEYAADQEKKPLAATAVPPPGAAPNSVPSTPPRLVTLTFSGPVWHATVETVDGQKVEEWSDGFAQYFSSNGAAGPLVVPQDVNHVPLLPDFGKSSFMGMEWVGPGTYAGVQSLAGGRCFVFRQNDITVWIDMETLYPVQWQRPGETRHYVQLPKPGEIALPAPFQDISKRYKRFMRLIGATSNN